jgi:hypothetical protein
VNQQFLTEMLYVPPDAEENPEEEEEN